MRVNRLDLLRYGRFQNDSIAFPRRDGQPDVTVVYGPNEAGKSTAFHAFLELLFGFKPGAHPYAYRFERADLLVGAEIDLPGRGPTVLRRNSKRTRSLLDDQDRPLDEAILSSALHGLGREAYEERFSLDDTSLRVGGARVAAAQGDLGQLLHAGLSGLTGMAQTLDALSARADGFHKRRGRGTVLKQGADRLRELRRILRAERLTAERAEALRRASSQTQAAYDTAQLQLREARSRLSAAQAAQVWWRETQVVERLTRALDRMPPGPDLPRGAEARVAGLVEKIAAEARRSAEAAEEAQKQQDILERTPEDRAGPALVAELERLEHLTLDGAPLLSRASTAQADLSRRQTALATQAQEIAQLQAELSFGPVSPEAGSALDTDLLEALSEAVQACGAADQAVEAARQAEATARQRLGPAPDAPRDLTLLRQACEAWDRVADLAGLETTCQLAAQQVTRASAGLPQGWRAHVAAGLPAREALDQLARAEAALTAEAETAQRAVRERAEDLAGAQAEAKALQETAAAIDFADVEETRRLRDLAWQAHCMAFSQGTAEAFERAMLADDAARAQYLTGAEARERRQNQDVQLRRAEAREAAARAHLDQITAQLAETSRKAGRLALALGYAEDTPVSALPDRLDALLRAAEAEAQMRIAQADLSAARTARTSAFEALDRAARGAGITAEAAQLPQEARRVLTLESTTRAAWEQWRSDAKALSGLEKKTESAVRASTSARARLGLLTAPLPLRDRAPEAVQAVLPGLRRLHLAIDTYQKLRGRIEALEAAIAAFREGAGRLARIMAGPEAPEAPEVPEADDDPVAILDMARQRAADFRHSDATRRAAQARLEESEATKQRATQDKADAEAALWACFDGQGPAQSGCAPSAPNLPDPDPSDPARAAAGPVARMAELVRRDTMRADLRKAEQVRRDARDGAERALFDAELALLPDETREAELREALDAAEEARDTARDAQREAARLENEAYAASDRSDLATEQATLREELRDGARSAAVARLGVLAARGALRRLAAERRGSMVRDVEDAFVAMTTPAWTGVDVWSQTEGDKLVGIQPGGQAVPVEQMSTGTMGQLYFALRLAGYRSFARAPGPLPMVLDDIMETFDDARARAALGLCAGIGEVGQAILFTHHAHLVTLAQETIDGVAVVQMPALPGAD